MPRKPDLLARCLRPWASTAVAVLGASLIAAFGCIDIAPPEYRQEERIVPVCADDADCGDDRCDATLGRCVARMRGFAGLLLDVVPESVDTGFGGLHIQEYLTEIASDAASPKKLELLQPPSVSGLIGIETCTEMPSVRITFVPRLSHLGLSLGRYTTVSSRDFPDSETVPVHRYDFAGIPTGSYDVHWEDSGESRVQNLECEVVPQLFRNVQVAHGAEAALIQPADTKRRLQVLIPYSNQFVDWTVDIVHSLTGEVLSTRRVASEQTVRDIPDSQAGEKEFALELKLAQIQGTDYVSPSEALLLRLSPPPGQLWPTLSFSLFGLVAVTPDTAQLAPLPHFGRPVQFSAWVLAEDGSTPLQGSVEFVATELSDVQGPGRVEFSTAVTIGEEGLLEAPLPAGVYRARVRPGGSSHVFETSVRTWPPDSSGAPDVQAGVILAPKGFGVSGRVRVPYRGVSANGTMIHATGLTSVSLKQAFKPRSAAALARDDGRFRLSELDCGSCTADNELHFTLTAKPPADLGLPWSIKSRVSVSRETVTDFDLSFPAVHYGELTFRKRNGTRGAFPGALIRALAFVDAEGRVVPLGTPRCFELPSESVAAGATCARATVEVAQARSDNVGQFRLMLPTDLAEFGR